MGNVIRLSYFFTLLLISLLASQACAPLGETGNANNARTYDQDFNKMVKVVERAIRGSTFNIAYADDSKADIFLMIINRESHVGRQSVQSDQGEVRLRRVSEGQTQVEIENPDYHFSVPDNQKINYQRILFNHIDSQLKKES